MSTTTRPGPASTRPSVVVVGGLSMIAGGITFVAGGATHPRDSGHGNKVEQLHDMLVDGAWYPSHLLLVVSFGLFAVGVLALRQRSDLDATTGRIVRIVGIVAVLATAGMTVHLLEAVNAATLADGEANLYSWLQTANEILVDATWGLSMSALALAGGRSGTIGNRATLVLGLVGGVCFALASATIPFTDMFDGLFPVATLLGLWAVIVGILGLRRR